MESVVGRPVSTLSNPEYAEEIVRFVIREIAKENRKRGKNEQKLQLTSAGEEGRQFTDMLQA